MFYLQQNIHLKAKPQLKLFKTLDSKCIYLFIKKKNNKKTKQASHTKVQHLVEFNFNNQQNLDVHM